MGIKMKRSSVTGKAPVVADLELGELAVNTTDGKLYMKKSVSGTESVVEVGPVASVAGRTGAVTLAKADVGLANVDNTSDASKPVSTATQTALNAKADGSRQIATGTGLTGGGSLAADRTIAADIATQAEAEAGTSATKLMTPQRVAQAIVALGGSAGGGIQVEGDTPVNTQTFNNSGTWTKPETGNYAVVELWGGGGSGGRGGGSTTPGGGGGGGGYKRLIFAMSELAATVAVTIGAGGAGRTTAGVGNAGGNTSFGALGEAYGGAGGLRGGAAADGDGGGGGGGSSAGSGQSGGANNFTAKAVFGTASDGTLGYLDLTSPPWLSGVGGNGSSAGSSILSFGDVTYGGGGGGAHVTGASSVGGRGGQSVYGGGGGGAPGTGSAGAGGTSTFGGKGSAGAMSSTASAAGTQPGGGSGGTVTGNTGAGGAGRCVVTVY